MTKTTKANTTKNLSKPKLAMYWGAGCGGCEIALIDTDEDILTIANNFDFMFCPELMDTKYDDIRALPDKSIKVTLYNGGVRTGEQEELAHLLRKKSDFVIDNSKNRNTLRTQVKKICSELIKQC